MANKMMTNLKKSVTAAELKDLGWAGLGGVMYTMLPTPFKVNGWGGLAIAVGGTWLAGALFDIRGLRSAAVGVGVAHLMYGFANPKIQEWFGVPIWKFNAGLGDYDTTASLPAGSGVVQNPSTGEYILAQQPTDLPALPAQGVMDYVNAPEAGVSDYAAALPTNKGASGRFLP